jgi:RNA polymerase sigma factor (sigma-70 family)
VNARLLAELRPVGFAVAYRMLGSVSEAEDIVQEAFLRLHHTLKDGERIQAPRAYLSRVVTRLCIDHLRSARARSPESGRSGRSSEGWRLAGRCGRRVLQSSGGHPSHPFLLT